MSRLHASLIFGLVACGSNAAAPDAAKAIDAAPAFDAKVFLDAPTPIDAAILVDSGPHADAEPAMGTMHHYVANHEEVPATTQQAKNDGLDLNGDNVVDNQFGMVLATFQGMGFDSQTGIDTAFSHGTTLLLAALQTSDFTTATTAGFTIYGGANPMPLPCSSSTDTVCGHHLTGTGTFDIAPNALIDPPLVGNFVTGTLTTPVGDSVMPLPLAFGAAPFTVNLVAARVQVTAASATGLTAILAGAITNAEMTAKVYPAFAVGVNAAIAMNCTQMNPPGCGCTSGSNGAQLLSLFDTNKDCTVTATELAGNSIISNLFTPDITVDGMPALSVGVKITAVAGAFTGP